MLSRRLPLLSLVCAALVACGDRGVRRAGAAAAAPVPPDTAPVDTALERARAATARLQQLCASDSVAIRHADSLRADSLRADSLRADSLRADSMRLAANRADSARDSTVVAANGLRSDPPRRPAPRHRRATPWSGTVARRAVAHVPLPGSLFPGCRVVAYYGNPLSKRMGILGELPPDSMLARLARQAEAYARADSAVPVLPALELIATVAQASAGRDSMYRLRMPDSVIAEVAAWAERENYLLILDIQTGRSSVAAELRPLLPYLARPYVHLALDPEFAMRKGRVPGRVIGTLDAQDVNLVIDTLAQLVTERQLPPKMLIVHRFTGPMVTNHERIRLDPRVQVVIDMDGFGAPHLKRDSYRRYVHDRPVQFAGFKLFYKNDKPLLTAEQVLKLVPVPLFIMYQ